MRVVRRLGAITLVVAVGAAVGIAAIHGFAERPVDGGGWVEALFAISLLLPPALFLALALVLLLRGSLGPGSLALIALAVLVGAPTLFYFLGPLVGALLVVIALVFVGVIALSDIRRTAAG